ncbi:hypothetical protein BD289DRAFT_77174 [Coniella lustricola]|uniref:Uncharacterized protein n=1 Tax=Coniella lustricola TaxID=2025994 RepID=A0A2T2ZZH4_9PEZI|nr:hypothetical protein BD289DRAFT_77174 [Coniella lustricola]
MAAPSPVSTGVQANMTAWPRGWGHSVTQSVTQNENEREKGTARGRGLVRLLLVVTSKLLTQGRPPFALLCSLGATQRVTRPACCPPGHTSARSRYQVQMTAQALVAFRPVQQTAPSRVCVRTATCNLQTAICSLVPGPRDCKDILCNPDTDRPFRASYLSWRLHTASINAHNLVT